VNDKGLEYALRRTHHGENEIVQQLSRLAERHRVEHEVHHVALDLIGWSRLNIARLADVAAGHGVTLAREANEPGRVRHALDAMAAKTPGTAPALLLLEDLRDAYLVCSETSLAWEMLAQLAQARRDQELLDTASACHPQTLRQMRWANTMIKTLAPQALVSI
jgi:hypothetical protein